MNETDRVLDNRNRPAGLSLSRDARKTVFLAFCLLPFLILPILSLDAGISGDEPVHYQQAEYVVSYFGTDGKDTAALHTPETNLKYYGQSIDNLSYRINRLIKASNPYTTRHILCSLSSAVTILFAALLAVRFAGYAGGILTILLLLFSPVFLGHSFNNLKDIPFAMGYVMAIYYLTLFIGSLPRIRTWSLAGIAVGTGISLSIRAGGLFLFPVIVLFVLGQAWLVRPRALRIRYWAVMTGLLAFTLALAWFIGLTDWPWGRLDPIGNPLKALGVMSQYPVNIRQLFEGSLIWSDSLPWYYALKYLLITTPLVILIAIPFSFLLPPSSLKHTFSFLLPPSSFLFPLLWVMLTGANLYGGIRHLLFIYPILAVLSAFGWVVLFNKLKKRMLRIGLILILLAGLALPALHIGLNHPVEYVYFNELAGGVNKTFGRYEQDYYYHSLGPATRWLRHEILSGEASDSLRIASNFPLDPYLLSDSKPFVPIYTSWYERGCAQWDYGLFVNAYLSPAQLRNGTWPPPETIHTIRVGDIPVCAVVKRGQELDYQGYLAYKEGHYNRAREILLRILETQPSNETALLYLGWTYRKLNDYTRSNEQARQLLSFHPESEPARELIIWNYLETGQFGQAIALAEELLRTNPRYEPAGKLLDGARDSLKSAITH